MRLVVAVGVATVAVGEAGARDLEHVARDIDERAVADHRVEAFGRNGVPHGRDVLEGPCAGQRFGGVESGFVIEQADPEGRQRADAPPRPAIRAAHLQETLQADIGKQRREMVRPVAHGRHTVRHLVAQGAVHELAEGDMGDVVIAAVTDQEIHRHVERPFGIVRIAEFRREAEREQARTLVVGVAPDFAAPGLEAVRLALRERRIGEQRGRQRLQLQRDLHLAPHVGFRREVEIHLDRAAAVHHVEAVAADLRHVGGHDVVARFRHARRLGKRPFRAAAKAEKPDAERFRDLAQLREMGVALAAGLMDRLERCAREFELAARLERDRALSGRLDEPDDVTGIDDRIPAEHLTHAFEQRPDAVVAAIGNRRIAVDIERKLFVLRSDPPLGFGLLALRHVADQRVKALDGAGIGGVARHHYVLVLRPH